MQTERQTDRQTDMTKVIVAFCNIANASKKTLNKIIQISRNDVILGSTTQISFEKNSTRKLNLTFSYTYHKR